MMEEESIEAGRRSRLKRFIKSRAFLNASTSVALQIVTIVNGLIVPRLIIGTFGSEMNGLVLSINQFLSYISLAEGGITGVVSASLYRALRQHDDSRVLMVYATMTRFYRKIVALFLSYVAIISVVFTVMFRGEFDPGMVFALVWILAIVQIIQYGLALAPRTLLNADRKVYAVSLAQIGMSVLSLVLTLACIKIWPNILVLKLLTGACYLVQSGVFVLILRRQYGWYSDRKRSVEIDNKLFKKRWDGLAISLAAFIHNNTDIVILTVFTGYAEISVYGVYLLVTAGIRGLVQAVSRGVAPSLGYILASDNKVELRRYFKKYRLVMFGLITVGFTLAFVLIRPFVSRYTRGLTDVNYDRPVFAILMLAAEMVYLLRESHVNLAYTAGKFKELSRACFVEVAINIAVSLVAVQFWTLEGVVLGTLLAMAWRTIYQVNFSRKILSENST